MLAVIGEMFGEPNVVGIGMAIRSREDLLSVWNEDNSNDQVQCYRVISGRAFVLGGEASYLFLFPNAVCGCVLEEGFYRYYCLLAVPSITLQHDLKADYKHGVVQHVDLNKSRIPNR